MIKKKDYVVFDLEVYPNYFLIGFKSVKNLKVVQLEIKGENESLSLEQRKKVRMIMTKYTIVGFNSQKYDLPVILKSLEVGFTAKQIFRMSTTIIQENYPYWMSVRNFAIELVPNSTHIDISEVAKGVMISLKMYGARLHSKKLQDLPYEFDTVLTAKQMQEIKEYNVNDLDTTIDLFNFIYPDIELRYLMSEQYNTDLMSKSDAQIAEQVIITELRKKNIIAKKVSLSKNYTIKYKAPDCISFQSEHLQNILEKIKSEAFELDGKGSPKIPDWLKKEVIEIGDTKYNIGLGGLHSMEKRLVVKSDDNNVMRNADVASYYPSMMIEFGFYPKSYGKNFLEIYKNLYHTRMKAKASGDKRNATSLKITLNGTFGKLGNKYSKIYSPDLMLHVTFTGQLLLLMLIEQLELNDIPVVSSNTDGVEYFCAIDKQDLAEAIIFDWELLTGMIMEHGTYDGLYARDVNNYIAVYDGYTKAKGAYCEERHMYGLIGNNREYDIVFQAIANYLMTDEPIEDYIKKCKDVRKFVCVKKSTGGAKWNDNYLGKTVRWYYGVDGEPILNAKSGNKVAKSDGAIPLMTLPENNEIPDDIDYERYIELGVKHLKEMGVIYERA